MSKQPILAVLFLCCLFLSTEINVTIPVSAAMVEEDSSEGRRISVESEELFINQRTVFRVILKDRTQQEDLMIVSEDEEIVGVQGGKWREDRKTCVLVPKKAGVVTLKITGVVYREDNQQIVEERFLRVYVSERKVLTPNSIYDQCSQAMVELLAFDSVNHISLGSGFFIAGDQIVTNYHVIEDASRLIVRDYNGKTYEVTHLIDYNKCYDMAILKVKEKSEHALVLNRTTVETGETAYALGSPLELTGTLSEGIVSNAYRMYENVTYHQSTAYISKNSGGGPLLNAYGEVIGVNTLMLLGMQNVYLAVDIQYITHLDHKEIEPITVLYDKNKDKVKEEIIYIFMP